MILEELRRKTDLVGLVGLVVDLKKKGASHFGLCPFHKEKMPSFHVNARRGLYHCFGCGMSGDAIKFVQEILDIGFADAVRYLEQRL